MASKEQFEAFKYLFEWEEERAKSLSESGKVYLTLITLFFAYLGYKVTDGNFELFLRYRLWDMPVPLALYLIMTTFLLAALLLTLYSLFIRPYQQIVEAESFFEHSVALEDTDEEFFDRYIVNMNLATGNNSAVNNSRATCLLFAAVCLFAGFLLYGAVFGISAWCKIGSCIGGGT